MRLEQTVKINDVSFTVKELTVKEIITLVNNATFYHMSSDKEEIEKEKQPLKELKIEDVSNDLVMNTILGQIDGFNIYKKDLEAILELSASFKLEDLVSLTPTEINEIIDAFKQVNASFLSVLTSLGVNKIMKDLWDVFTMGFSKRLVT